MTVAPAGALKRILGLGFGLAIVFGGTVGVGILRLPGELAAQLGDSETVLTFWILGGAYALLGAVSVAELASMMPRAGGFYIYAKRAFGGGVGFAVGWSDWLNNVAALAYGAITVMTFLSVLWPAAAPYRVGGALTALALFLGLHWLGLEIGSTLTRVISVTIGLMMMLLVVACFLAAPADQSGPAEQALAAATRPSSIIALLSAWTAALRAVLLTYDGWYSSIYLSEESMQPERTLPRSLIGGTIIIAILYILINASLLRALPLSVMAASTLPAAEAARRVLPSGGAVVITVVSLLTVLSLLNAMMLIAPRILLAMGRDGLFTRKAAQVSRGGTPRVALVMTTLVAAALVLTGTFEQILAFSAVLFLLVYLSAYAAVFILRYREAAQARAYRAFGYPLSTGVVTVGCALALVAAVANDPRSGVMAAGLLLLCVPVYYAFKRFGARLPPS